MDSADLTLKYLNAQPRWIQDEAKKEAAWSGIYLHLRVARDAVTFVEVNLRLAGREPDLSQEEHQPREGRRRGGGMVNVMEGAQGGGQRPPLGQGGLVRTVVRKGTWPRIAHEKTGMDRIRVANTPEGRMSGGDKAVKRRTVRATTKVNLD